MPYRSSRNGTSQATSMTFYILENVEEWRVEHATDADDWVLVGYRFRNFVTGKKSAGIFGPRARN